MAMNNWLLLIIVFLLGDYFLEQILSYLNIKALDNKVPEEFQDTIDAEKYRKSQEYTRATSKFGLVQSTFSILVLLVFLLSGGFNSVDLFVRSFQQGSIVSGILYIGILLLLSSILALPFSFYSTFVIEERFGFNNTTIKTFCTDIIKGLFLSILIGVPILYLILWFFETTGGFAWLYCWIGLTLVSIVLQFLAPVLIMPLFNKFTPLEDGKLKEKVLSFAKEASFSIQGIYTMDGSKRSSKLNAFFTGFGKFRKIVFYDTLLEKLDEDEIVAVLAHEMGHYKKRHIFKMMAISICHTGLLFFLLSLFIGNENLFAAFQMDNLSTYGALIFFSFLFSPVNLLLGIAINVLSRKHEFQADHYAADPPSRGKALVSGLKKLSVANLSNLTPHPAMVFFHYSHPPVLQRIQALQE
ncbi:MAG TPA: M48 family peptidase [Desulfocapsa sulfexigens]|nr:M48 family peptidase [Desulfocapsa sulfexigens]